MRLSRPPWDVLGLVVLFGASGTLHLIRPRPYQAIVPRPLPAKRELVYVSGVAELVCAAGLAVPATRKSAGLASAVLLVAVFPANVQMAIDVVRRRGRVAQALAILRLPLQAPLIRTAWRAYRR